MGLTKEKAISILQHLSKLVQYEDYKETFELAISAIRPLTRQKVEKVKAVFCQLCEGDFEQDTWRCSNCYVQEFGDIRGINFCPHCGSPMTEEAVDIFMKRLEVMRDEAERVPAVDTV